MATVQKMPVSKSILNKDAPSGSESSLTAGSGLFSPRVQKLAASLKRTNQSQSAYALCVRSYGVIHTITIYICQKMSVLSYSVCHFWFISIFFHWHHFSENKFICFICNDFKVFCLFIVSGAAWTFLDFVSIKITQLTN